MDKDREGGAKDSEGAKDRKGGGLRWRGRGVEADN